MVWWFLLLEGLAHFYFGRIMAWHIIKGAAEKCGIQNISTHSTRK
ncbi:hypothetical protein C169_23105, partial [Paenibacillus sp. FSL R5-808]